MEGQLWSARFNGNVEEVTNFLQNTQIDLKGYSYGTPFLIACDRGHIEIVKLLLNDNRVDVNKANKYGWTPFSTACEKGYIEIVKLLLNDQRIDINQTNYLGQTPFWIACGRGYLEIVEYTSKLKAPDVTLGLVNFFFYF